MPNQSTIKTAKMNKIWLYDSLAWGGKNRRM